MKKAFITGITGQDGSYMAEILLEKGYEVHGLVRRSSSFNTMRIDHLYKNQRDDENTLFLHYGDLSDYGSLQRLFERIIPDEVYHLAAQSHVRISFEIPEYTTDVVALGNLRILEIIRDLQERVGKRIKFYQASSSEMFGSSRPPQNEKTQFCPRSPYATAKVFAYYNTINYREAYKIFGVNGILFNHESPRRGDNFVTRKITSGIAKILSGEDDKICLGNLDAKRDWGYAKEYMEAAWIMMQHKNPDDFVIGTGETHSVRDFLTEAFNVAGIENWEKYIIIDQRYFRPTEVDVLQADFSKAKRDLNWEPKTTFKDLVRMMVTSDIRNHLKDEKSTR